MAQDPQVHEILLRVDLVDLIGSSVKLTRSGRSYKGLCPFHPEKTPSFHVYPADGVKPGFFHCYGCKKGGDALTYLVEREGLSFPEALERLGAKVGVEILRQKGPSKEQRQSRLEFLDLCQSHFRANLRHPEKGAKARNYLRERSVDPKLADRFGLGYALDSWETLTNLFRGNRENLNLALAQSLCKRNDRTGGLHDFFVDRLMFPIHGPSGQLLAFAGRDLSGQTGAKYLNTSETDLFKKGRALYGFHQAREGIRESRRAILVEGYFDVIRMHAAGFEETVAPMGTAVTPEHVSLLERQAEELILLFDGDAAGIAAALRSLDQTWNSSLSVRVAPLPEGSDPDDFILSHSREEMASLLEEARPSFEYFLDRCIETHGLGAPDRAQKSVMAIFESLANIESSLQAELRLKQVADRTGLGFEALKRDWDRFSKARSQKKGPSSSTGEASQSAPPLASAESRAVSIAEEARKGLLSLLLLDEERLASAMGNTFAAHPEARKCLGLVLETMSKEKDDRDAFRPVLEAYLERGPKESRKVWESSRGNDRLRWEIEAVLREENIPEDPLRSLRDYAAVLRKAEIDRRISEAKEGLMASEKNGDWESVSRLAARIDELIEKRERVLSPHPEEVA